MKTLFALIAFTNPAWALCNPDERTFLTCEFPNGKYVEVCMNDEYVRYRFGRLGQSPELHLARSYGDGAEAVPWNGVGRAIWEAVRLTNGDITYEVYGGFDKIDAIEDNPDAGSPFFGGIFVTDGQGTELAHLQCIPSTVDYSF